MIVESIGLGLFLSLVFYEIMGLTPGGLVVPGYLSLVLNQPGRALGTIGASLLCLFIIRGLTNFIILFGRRKFVLGVLIGFLLARLMEMILAQAPDIGVEIRSIGYIIPGLLAHEMDRQGIVRTLLFAFLVAGTVRLLLLLWKGWAFI